LLVFNPHGILLERQPFEQKNPAVAYGPACLQRFLGIEPFDAIVGDTVRYGTVEIDDAMGRQGLFDGQFAP
jgi:hypothetical protein